MNSETIDGFGFTLIVIETHVEVDWNCTDRVAVRAGADVYGNVYWRRTNRCSIMESGPKYPNRGSDIRNRIGMSGTTDNSSAGAVAHPHRWLLVPVASPTAAKARVEDVLSFARSAKSGIVALFVMTKETVPQREKGERACAVFDRRCAAAGLPLECLVRAGDIVEVILDTARRYTVDAIILGASEHSLFERLFRTNIPKTVVRRAGRPVLIVARAPSSDSDAGPSWRR